MLYSQAGAPKWWETQWGEGAGRQRWNMKEIVDIYCFMPQSELHTENRGFLVAPLQSNVVILNPSGDTNIS